MSRCPFWSTEREKVECYKECPMLSWETIGEQDGEQCIFNGCSESSDKDFRSIMKDDYSFMNSYIYDEEQAVKINY